MRAVHLRVVELERNGERRSQQPATPAAPDQERIVVHAAVHAHRPVDPVLRQRAGADHHAAWGLTIRAALAHLGRQTAVALVEGGQIIDEGNIATVHPTLAVGDDRPDRQAVEAHELPPHGEEAELLDPAGGPADAPAHQHVELQTAPAGEPPQTCNVERPEKRNHRHGGLHPQREGLGARRLLGGYFLHHFFAFFGLRRKSRTPKRFPIERTGHLQRSGEKIGEAVGAGDEETVGTRGGKEVGTRIGEKIGTETAELQQRRRREAAEAPARPDQVGLVGIAAYAGDLRPVHRPAGCRPLPEELHAAQRPLEADDPGILPWIHPHRGPEAAFELLFAQAGAGGQFGDRRAGLREECADRRTDPVELLRTMPGVGRQLCQQPPFDEADALRRLIAGEDAVRQLVQRAVSEVVARDFTVVEQRERNMQKSARRIGPEDDRDCLCIARRAEMGGKVHLAADGQRRLQGVQLGNVKRGPPMEEKLRSPGRKGQRLRRPPARIEPVIPHVGLQRRARAEKGELLLKHGAKVGFFAAFRVGSAFFGSKACLSSGSADLSPGRPDCSSAGRPALRVDKMPLGTRVSTSVSQHFLGNAKDRRT